MNIKWLAPVLPYLAVWAGLFLLNSAWFALIGFHVAMLFALAIARPTIPVSILIKNKRPTWAVANILVCGASGVLLYFLWDIFNITNNLSAQLQSIGLNSSSWFLFIAYFSLVNPFIEEYFWRGFLGSAAKTLYVSDFAYAGYHALVLHGRVHLLSILFAVVCLTATGWLWRQIHREDEGLLASALGHLAADFTILACVYFKTI